MQASREESPSKCLSDDVIAERKARLLPVTLECMLEEDITPSNSSQEAWRKQLGEGESGNETEQV